MNTSSFDLAPDRHRARRRSHRQRYAHAGRSQTDDGFLCKLCNAYVSSASFLSGVQNRNHCPYCLWSRHLDLYAAGDRLSACKSPMRPIGLTVKATRKKYGSGHGELMLIHLCTDCTALSINRIAADDDPQKVFDVFEGFFRLDVSTQTRLDAEGIRALTAADSNTVSAQLFGHKADLAEMLFSSKAVATLVASND